MDDLVLVRAQAQRDVLVGNPGQQMIGQLVRLFDEVGGEGGNRSGQGLLLAAVSLVSPVEQAIEQVRPRLKHVFVEPFGNFFDVFPHHRQRCLDDGAGSVREHDASFRGDRLNPAVDRLGRAQCSSQAGLGEGTYGCSRTRSGTLGSMREFVALGTASQVPTRTRNHNGYVLRWDGEGLLFDPGEGTQRQMIHAGVPATQITRICLTHVHGDHCFGLPGVLSRMALDGVSPSGPPALPGLWGGVVRALVSVSTPGIDLRLYPHGGAGTIAPGLQVRP